jgi:hypothetical protein
VPRLDGAYGRERLQLTGTMVHLLGLDLELTGQGAVRTAVELAAGINPADIGQAGICCRDLVFDWCATGQPALLADFVDHDTVDFDFRAKTGPWTFHAGRVTGLSEAKCSTAADTQAQLVDKVADLIRHCTTGDGLVLWVGHQVGPTDVTGLLGKVRASLRSPLSLKHLSHHGWPLQFAQFGKELPPVDGVLCTLRLARICAAHDIINLQAVGGKLNLMALYKALVGFEGAGFEGAHNALCDTQATLEVRLPHTYS